MIFIYFMWLLLTVIIDDCEQFFKCGVKVIVDYQVIKFGPMRYFRLRIPHPALYHFCTILSATGQSFAQNLERRGNDENKATIRKNSPYLACALPVDFKYHVTALLKL